MRSRYSIFVCYIFILELLPIRTMSVNVLHINDKMNPVAMHAAKAVFDYIEKYKSNIKVDLRHVYNSADYLTTEAVCDRIDSFLSEGKTPHIVIDTTLSGVNSELAKLVTRQLKLATVSTSYGTINQIRQWQNISEQEAMYLVHIRPPGDLIPNLIADIIVRNNITSAGILYDNSFVMDYKYMTLLHNIECRYIISRVGARDTVSDTRTALLKFQEIRLSHIFVLGTRSTQSLVMEVGDSLKMHSRQHSWHVISKDITQTDCNCRNVTFIHTIPHIPDEGESRLNQLRNDLGYKAKPEVEAIFYFDVILSAVLAASAMIDDRSYKTFRVYGCASEKVSQLTDILELRRNMIHAASNSSIGSLMLSTTNGSYMELKMDIYLSEIVDSRVVTRDMIGKYAVMPYRGVFEDIKSRAFRQVETKVVYKVVTVRQPPFVYKELLPNQEVRFTGYIIDLLDLIAKEMNFDYTIYEVADGKYGFMDENGQWNGIIRDMIDKKADIGVGAISVMAEREAFVDFTLAFYDVVGTTILMKRPVQETTLFRFLTVLEADVWGSIIGMFFITSIILWIFDKFSPYSYQNNMALYVDDEEQRVFSIRESFWFCMTSLTPQGGGIAPKCLSARLVAATWWLFGFIIIASYTANLVAFLTVSRLEADIESLDNLYNQYKVKYAPVNGSASMHYFKRMSYIEEKFYQIWKSLSLNHSIPIVERAKTAVYHYPINEKYTNMWNAMQQTGLAESFEEGVERVRMSASSHEGFALLAEETIIDYILMTSCDLMKIGEPFSSKPYAFVLQKGSPLKRTISQIILRTWNDQTLEVFMDKWWRKNKDKKVCDNDAEVSDGVNIYNMAYY